MANEQNNQELNNNYDKKTCNFSVKSMFFFEKHKHYKECVETIKEENKGFKQFIKLAITRYEFYFPCFKKLICFVFITFLLISIISPSHGVSRGKTPLSQSMKSIGTATTSSPELDASTFDYATLYQDALNRLDKPEYSYMSDSEKDHFAKLYIQQNYNVNP